jgi:outer membrane protein assembly factor BamB
MSHRIILSIVATTAVWLTAIASAADWLQWRGPKGTGQTQIEAAPLTWSKEENVKWRVPLDGKGNSSPIVVGSRVFITHAPDKSKARGLHCYDRNTGDLLWKHEIEYGEEEKTHGTNPYCSSSPTSDGQRVMAWYGSPGLFCYDLEGKVLWQKELGKVEHIWGFASSPVFYENLVILNYGPGVNSFVVAFDKTSGDEVWRKEYPEQKSAKIEDYRGSWSTPIFYQEGERTLMLLTLPMRLWSIDPKTGEEVWWCDAGKRGELYYTSPILAGDVAIAMCGYGGPAMGVKIGGQGDVTETNQLWRHPGNPQRVGSGVVVNDHVYILNETGVAWCLDPKTGEKKWEERLGGAKSWCSTAHVAGRLYTSNEDGVTLVWEPSTEGLKVLAENKLGELTRASPAYSDGQIFIRTYEALYCIEEKK